VYSIAREKEKFQVDAIPELEMEDKNKLQRAIAVLPKVRANYVLVICRTEHLATIMEKVHLASCYRKLHNTEVGGQLMKWYRITILRPFYVGFRMYMALFFQFYEITKGDKHATLIKMTETQNANCHIQGPLISLHFFSKSKIPSRQTYQ